MTIPVHKAVEPEKLSKAGQKAFDNLLSRGGGILLPKYDGVYVQFYYDGTSWQARSRTGQPMPAVRHLLTYFALRAAQDRIYIGEVWNPRTPHAEINGAARRRSWTPGLQVVLHDSVSVPNLERYGVDPTPFVDRFRLLLTLPVISSGISVASVLNPSLPVSTWEQLVEHATVYQRRQLEEGSVFDGLVLRDPLAHFLPGDGKHGGLYKVKPRKSLDLLIVDATVEQRPTKLGGYLTVEYRGVRTDVGSGLTQDMLGNLKEYVGQIAEIEFLELTKDGKLREPVFKSIRLDKENPDG